MITVKYKSQSKCTAANYIFKIKEYTYIVDKTKVLKYWIY